MEELGFRPAGDRRGRLWRRRGHRERLRRDDRDGHPRARGHVHRARPHAGRVAGRAHAPRRLHRRRSDPPRGAGGDRDRLLGHPRQERGQAGARPHGRPRARSRARLCERLVPGRAHTRGDGGGRPRRRREGLHRAQVRSVRRHLAHRHSCRGGARDRPDRGGPRRDRAGRGPARGGPLPIRSCAGNPLRPAHGAFESALVRGAGAPPGSRLGGRGRAALARFRSRRERASPRPRTSPPCCAAAACASGSRTRCISAASGPRAT